MKLNRWHDFVVIESMTPLGSYRDDDGKMVARFEMKVRRRWWFFLHPLYWYGFFGGKR